jgi:hypothetical protein
MLMQQLIKHKQNFINKFIFTDAVYHVQPFLCKYFIPGSRVSPIGEQFTSLSVFG